ncbi:MAG: hypothetical protein KJ052_21105, partial [Candidatus Hydrogenedentes bacterium]|nr:hypothetical protein [Candidatus Hydrogenedentota bacterium]
EDLFSLEAFAPALSRFCEPPALSELDALIPRIRQAYALIGFSDAQALSRWALRPELPVPYRETLLAIMALGYAHHAEAFEAQSHFTALAELLTDHHDKLGADDWLKSFATLAVFAFDACAPEILMPLSKLAVARLPWASLAARGAYWGSQCQVLRLTGDFDAAINAGERAVACAEEGEISAAGRNMNYLVHALLHRARKGGPDAEADRALARKLLHISRTQWRPSVGGRSHDGFCSLYEAELARQEGQLPPSTWDDYRGEWSHGLDFCLLVRARNQNIAEPKRVEYLDFALSRLAGWEKTELGRLILGWYKLYRAHLAGEEIDPISTLLQRSMDAFEAAGLPGWKRRLGPPLSSVARCCGPDRDEAMEHFLDAIPYW